MRSFSAMKLKDRYMDDPHFHALVQQFLSFMMTMEVQPYEVRDAAFMAEILYREQMAVPIYKIFEKNKVMTE